MLQLAMQMRWFVKLEATGFEVEFIDKGIEDLGALRHLSISLKPGG